MGCNSKNKNKTCTQKKLARSLVDVVQFGKKQRLQRGKKSYRCNASDKFGPSINQYSLFAYCIMYMWWFRFISIRSAWSLHGLGRLLLLVEPLLAPVPGGLRPVSSAGPGCRLLLLLPVLLTPEHSLPLRILEDPSKSSLFSFAKF